MSIAQFQGEDRKEAIINHFSLDIEEEDEFFNFLYRLGLSENSPDDVIEQVIEDFRKAKS